MSLPIKTLALVGCSQKDESVIASLLNLLTDEIGHLWKINHRGDSSDCLLINTSSSEGISLWRAHESRGSQRIALTDGLPPEDAQNVLNTPIRAYELISMLKKNQGLGYDNTSYRVQPGFGVDSRYRLRRWPDPGVLRSHPGYIRLSATLLRHALTVEMLSDITHTPTSIVDEFIGVCRARGWLKEVYDVQGSQVVGDPRNPNRGLFSKIRARLGLNG